MPADLENSSDEPSGAERAAAAEHHARTCNYGGGFDDPCPLDDIADPLDRYLDEDLQAVREKGKA